MEGNKKEGRRACFLVGFAISSMVTSPGRREQGKGEEKVKGGVKGEIQGRRTCFLVGFAISGSGDVIRFAVFADLLHNELFEQFVVFCMHL